MAIQDEIPKSRLTLRYKTEVSGQPEDVSLPLRLLVEGDFSLGSSKDRKVDLEERRLRTLDGTNTDAAMKDMGMSLKFAVSNKIDPEMAEDMDVEIPIDSTVEIRAGPEKIELHFRVTVVIDMIEFTNLLAVIGVIGVLTSEPQREIERSARIAAENNCCQGKGDDCYLYGKHRSFHYPLLTSLSQIRRSK